MKSDRHNGRNEREYGLEALRSRKDLLGALASIAARISVYQDTRRLAREAMQAIADLMPIKTAVLLLRDDQTGSLVFHEAYNLPVEELERYHRLDSRDDSIEGLVVEGRETVLIEDVSLDARAVHYPDGSMSLGLIPLLARDRSVGVLSVTTAAPHRLDQSDMEFLLTLGSQLGIYLDNTRLLEELKTINARLVRQNQDLEELLSVISHDLRSPLATIAGYASLLIKKGNRLEEKERTRYAETIFRKTRETSRRFDDLLAVFQSDTPETQEKEVRVDTRALIEEAVEEAGQHTDLERFTVEVADDMPSLMGYPSLLLHIFTNLLSNSFKYIGYRDAPLVSVGYSKIPGGGGTLHCFSVRDNGRGIPEDYIASLFRPFTRVPIEEEISGSGIGLASVQRIVRSQGGSVDIDSIEGEGTTVTFTLPWKEIDESPEPGIQKPD